MTRRLAFSAFGKGRLSPLMRGRIDTEMYYASAEELDNIVIRPQGIPVRRIGTHYVNDTNVSTYTRLIPFVVSVADSYIVESSDLSFKMRDSDGEPIELDLDSVAAYSGGTPYVGGDTVTDATDFYVCIQDHTTAEALTETDFWYQLDLADGLTGTWEVELTTPYTTAQLPDVDFAQKDDTLKFTYQLHDIGELRRYADNVWVFVQGEVFGPPWEDLNEDIEFFINIVTRNAGDLTTAFVVDDYAELFTQADVDNGRYIRMDDANEDGEQGYFKVVAPYIDSYNANVEVILMIQNSKKTTKWAKNAFYTGNYPARITYHEGRMVCANTPTDKQKAWFSKSFAYNDFNITNTDDGGFDFTLNTDESNEIQWLSSGEGLAIGTFGGEFIANSPSDGVLTNENKNVRRQSNWGSELVRPRKIGSKLYYVQRGSRKIREYFYERDFNNYDSKDITEYAEDITISGVRDMAYQRNPDSLLWCVLENGTGAVLSRSPDSELMAWTPWETQGDVTGIMFLPNPDGEVDRGFIVVQRVLPTGTRQYLEYFDSHVIEEDTDIRNDRIFLDSVGLYDPDVSGHIDVGPYHHHGTVGAIPPTTGWPDLLQGNFSENVFWDSTTRKAYAVQTNSSTGNILMSIVEIDIDTWTITDTWTKLNDEEWPQLYEDWPMQHGRASYGSGKLVVLTNKAILTVPLSGSRGLIGLLYDMTAGTQTLLACDNYEWAGYSYTQNVDWNAGLPQSSYRVWSASHIDSEERLWLIGLHGTVGRNYATLGYIYLVADTVATYPYTYTEVEVIDYQADTVWTGGDYSLYRIDVQTTLCMDFDEANDMYALNGSGDIVHLYKGFLIVMSMNGGQIARYLGGIDDFPLYGLGASKFYNGKIYGGVRFYDVTDAGKGLVEINQDTGAITFYEPDPLVFTAADDYGITGIVACANDYLAMNTNQGLGIFDTIGKTWQLIDNAEITGLTVTGSDTVFAWDVTFDAENNWVVASLSNFEGSGTGQGVVLIDITRYTDRGNFDITHLEGLTVALMGDGDYLGDYLVTDGALPAYTPPVPELDYYYIGLKYTSLIKTNPLNAQTPQGMAAGQIRGINEVAINLYRTREMEYGNDLTTLSPLGIPEGKSADATDADYTGVVPNMTFDGRLDYVAYIYLRQAKPYTMNILGIYPEVEIS